MNTCYHHIDSSIRGYNGIQLTTGECSHLLSTSVRANLTDEEEREAMTADLTGLQQTGFSSANLLADIQALENVEPDDLRNWRIGEGIVRSGFDKSFSM